jgi:hypothetical protein
VNTGSSHFVPVQNWWVVLQLLPQLPQFRGSCAVSTQKFEQQVSEPLQASAAPSQGIAGAASTMSLASLASLVSPASLASLVSLVAPSPPSLALTVASPESLPESPGLAESPLEPVSELTSVVASPELFPELPPPQ